MRWFPLAMFVLATGNVESVEVWMQQAFYPVLLLILMVASLGVPIPEDIPLIVAGLLLRTSPGIATPVGTFIAAMIGIMAGDLVLYSLGRWWGPGVVNHRSVKWIITPERFTRLSRRFLVHGTWFCFLGRFVMGVRAVMCLTAGATRFPYWRFFIADFTGALLSAPLFMGLGYWFAGMLPTVLVYVDRAEAILLAGVLIAAVVAVVVYRRRKRRRKAQEVESRATTADTSSAVAAGRAAIPSGAVEQSHTPSR